MKYLSCCRIHIGLLYIRTYNSAAAGPEYSEEAGLDSLFHYQTVSRSCFLQEKSWVYLIAYTSPYLFKTFSKYVMQLMFKKILNVHRMYFYLFLSP